MWAYYNTETGPGQYQSPTFPHTRLHKVLIHKYQTERIEKTAQLKKLEQQMEKYKAVQGNVQEWTSLIRQYSDLDFLDRETLLRLIDKIEIGETQVVDGRKTRKVHIYYKFVGAVG